ncbi:MAG: NADH-quinone oxidoreductase subunit NuoK [Actinomycetota bacterium]|nr:NADH-quinone oxidoreductase subunit NuoK [Actinomycetota bacterium]
MAPVSIDNGLMVAWALFVLGFIGVLVRRDLVFVLMSIEVMLNAAGLAFILAGAKWGKPDGQVMFIFILATAAAEVALGLGLVLRFHHKFKTLDTDAASKMRG